MNEVKDLLQQSDEAAQAELSDEDVRAREKLGPVVKSHYLLVAAHAMCRAGRPDLFPKALDDLPPDELAEWDRQYRKWAEINYRQGWEKGAAVEAYAVGIHMLLFYALQGLSWTA